MAEPTEEERLLTGYSGRVLVLILLGTMAAFVERNIFGPLLPVIIEDLSITSSAAGLALSVMWVAIAVTQYPGGRLADQLSYKTVLVGAIGMLVVGFLLLILSSTYLGFVVGLTVMGLGAGLFTPSSYAQLAALFEARRGQAFGLYASSIDIGSALSGVLAIGVLALVAWRLAFVPVAVTLLVAMAAIHVFHNGEYVTGAVFRR